MVGGQDIGTVLEPAFWEPLVGSLIGAGVALASGAAIAWLLVFGFERWARATLTPIDDIFIKNLATPTRWFMPLVALFLAVPELDLKERSKAVLQHLVAVAITLTVSWLLFRVVRAFEEVVAKRAAESGSLVARSQYTQVRGLSNVVRFLIGLTTVGLILLSFAGI
ncbi:MAG TPA: hypothetical protein VF103_16655, partial [Polyangiaceae bacterium]